MLLVKVKGRRGISDVEKHSPTSITSENYVGSHALAQPKKARDEKGYVYFYASRLVMRHDVRNSHPYRD